MDESYCAEVDEGEEDGFGLSAENGDASDWVEGLHNMVQSLLQEGSIVQHSPELQSFTSTTEQETPSLRTPSTFIGTREIYGDLGDKEQSIAVMLVMEALDDHERHPHSATQHLQYLGGEGGTGKSRVIQAIYAVFKSLQQASAIILAAASGAAAEIGGITIHSAVQLSVGRDKIFHDLIRNRVVLFAIK